MHARNTMVYGLPWITSLSHSWGDSAIIFTSDAVTNYWRITPRLSKNIVIHGNPYIVLYIKACMYRFITICIMIWLNKHIFAYACAREMTPNIFGISYARPSYRDIYKRKIKMQGISSCISNVLYLSCIYGRSRSYLMKNDVRVMW